MVCQMEPLIPNCAATGIGSLPFRDTGPAIGLIRDHLPLIPHWPQLPARGAREGLIYQSFQALVETGLLGVDKGRAVFDTRAGQWPDRLTDYYSRYLAAEAGDGDALDMFAFREQDATGFFAFIRAVEDRMFPEAIRLKGQVVGPLTMGFQVKDHAGNLAFYDDQLRDLMVTTLCMNARWQCRRLASLNRPVIIFVDDPSIAAFGSHSHIALGREMVIECLNAVFDAIHEEGAIAGLHSCDAADWSLLFDSRVDVVSFDTYRFGESLGIYADALNAHIARGGMVAWGIVPTGEEAADTSAEALAGRLESLWASLGGDFFAHSLITPACGTGLLGESLARRIYQLTAAVSALLAP